MLILASASPRRHELLLAAGIAHVVQPSNIPEDRHPDESPSSYVCRIAACKVGTIAAADSDVVLGADTVVCVEGEVLGKPRDDRDAARMLNFLSGREHRVLTGIALRKGERLIHDLAETQVWFDEIAPDEIAEYIRTGEANDKAGAYAIQGYASRFVRRIEGSYHNVVGLPVSLVYRHLKEL
ncbi:MAG TPA: Maf family protein [Bryobacteraceae bacterium]|nr:Maf family protein [Bryobacteraceae bacterium]